MEDEEERGELEELGSDGVHSGLLSGDSGSEEILLSLPELEEQEVTGAFGDFGQRVVFNGLDHVAHARDEFVVLVLVFLVHGDFYDVGVFFCFCHCCCSSKKHNLEITKRNEEEEEEILMNKRVQREQIESAEQREQREREQKMLAREKHFGNVYKWFTF